jgi:serine/threonine-protein kinase
MLAGYTVRGKVGEGGTSTVFRADHPTYGTVALKVLREKLQQDKTAVARFLREAQFGARVEHPNIIRTLDYGQSDSERYYLAIEWASGDILDKYAEKAGALPSKDVAAILSQICSAVQAAHNVGIVHRDLKPENVMYDPATKQVKLLDFGIAADTDAAPDQRLTRAGFFVGTLMYVAPEALSGELVGPAADQYSLATIGYFLLTGALPYTGKSPRELFSQLLTQPPVSLNKAKPNLSFSPAVEEVVMKALSKQPGDRYASVQIFSDAFVAAANGGAPSGKSAPAPAAPAPATTSAVSDAGEDKGGGLFGKMKGLFGKK